MYWYHAINFLLNILDTIKFSICPHLTNLVDILLQQKFVHTFVWGIAAYSIVRIANNHRTSSQINLFLHSIFHDPRVNMLATSNLYYHPPHQHLRPRQ